MIVRDCESAGVGKIANPLGEVTIGRELITFCFLKIFLWTCPLTLRCVQSSLSFEIRVSVPSF